MLRAWMENIINIIYIVDVTVLSEAQLSEA